MIVALIAVPLLIPQLRKPFITAPLLKFYRQILPPLSQTERIALESGTVGFEGELFSGKPAWDKLLSQPKPVLTAEEQAFLDGPVEDLCKMINDWEITHVHADLTPELWDYVKRNKFFGMIIPKEYGGLGFSALRAPLRDPEDRVDLHRGQLHRRRAELARPRRTAGALRHAGAEGLLPAAPGRRPRSALLRPDRSFRRFRRHIDSRLRHRLPGRMERRQRRRHQAHLRQALHHARAGGHDHRPGVPHVRPGWPDRRQEGHRHHAGAAAARDRGRGSRAPPFPAQFAVPERSGAWPRSLHPAVAADRRRGLRRQGLADVERAVCRSAARSRCPPPPAAARNPVRS